MHLEHRLLANNVVIHTPADETVSVFGTTFRIESDVGRQGGLPAGPASIFPNQVARLPLLNTNPSLVVFEVDQPPPDRLFTCYLATSACRTAATRLGNNRGQRGPSLGLRHTLRICLLS